MILPENSNPTGEAQHATAPTSLGELLRKTKHDANLRLSQLTLLSPVGEVYALAVSSGAFQGRVSLDLPATLSFEDWSRTGEMLGVMECGVAWWIGDWWAFGQHAYGDRARAAAKGIFGRSFGTLRNLGSVARRFDTSRRRDVLPWKHHAEVAGLVPEKADELT